MQVEGQHGLSLLRPMATGATHVEDVDDVVRFLVEAAKEFTTGRLHFFDEAEFALLTRLYGTLERFQTAGNPSAS